MVVKDILNKITVRCNELYNQCNLLYANYHAILKLILIASIVMSSITWLDQQRKFFSNQEVFDLNDIPSGYVVWIYPKDKSQSAIMPDSLKKEFKITDDPTEPSDKLNYNVDIWVVGIYTSYNQIVKVDVPDYAIYQFKLGARFDNPSEKKP